MSFPFKHIPFKETFKFTFLNEVAFKLTFAGSLEDVRIDKWQVFFKETFGLDLSQARYDEMIATRIKIKSTDSDLEFEFARNTVKISVSQSIYSNYEDSLEPSIKTVTQNLCKIIDKCCSIEMKFVDVWPFAKDNNYSQQQIETLENAVISAELRADAETIDEYFKSAVYDDEKLKMYIEYGSYNHGEDHAKFGGVALETKCEYKDSVSGVKIANVVEIANNMNDILYDAFIWSVSPLVIELMKNKAVKD